jgi:hypothetical protein
MMLDLTKAYKVEGWGEGIAWRVIGYRTYKDADWVWTGYECIDETQVHAYMIGDDRVFEFDIEEITPIEDDEYCSECGQIGCKANG